MRLGILTRSLPPYTCGIGDHTLNLARHLRERGHAVELIASRGGADHGAVIVGQQLDEAWAQRVREATVRLRIELLVLQLTPQIYGDDSRTWRPILLELMTGISSLTATALIVHESYFRTWRRPQSLLRGTGQKWLLEALCRASDHVFTASQPLLAEMAGWGLRKPAALLPIGSNIPVANVDVAAFRAHKGIGESTLVLTLFGGGNNLKWMLEHVRLLERRLEANRVPHAWLLLGGVPQGWIQARGPVLVPGVLGLPELSAHLQMTDIFLMPHWCGVNAKRGTLIAALEHGLAVVGTRAFMTDALWRVAEGIALVDASDAWGFCEAVLRLASNRQRRRRYGELNRAFFLTHFTWVDIVSRFLSAVQPVKAAQ